jgi:hypothetical protein
MGDAWRLVERRRITLLVLCMFGVVATVHGQTDELRLKYLGAAGWEMTSGKLVVLIDPYISRINYGDAPTSDSRRHFSGVDPVHRRAASLNPRTTHTVLWRAATADRRRQPRELRSRRP